MSNQYWRNWMLMYVFNITRNKVWEMRPVSGHKVIMICNESNWYLTQNKRSLGLFWDQSCGYPAIDIPYIYYGMIET